MYQSLNGMAAADAERMLLDPKRFRFTKDQFSIHRDHDGFWLTNPYGVDCCLCEFSPAGARQLLERIDRWADPMLGGQPLVTDEVDERVSHGW